MERIYLDNNATTMVDPRVRDAMDPFILDMYGNPNSLHTFGSEARSHLHIAMDRLYTGIHADDDDDILVNGCATEGNNTVLKSVYYDYIMKGPRTQIITTQVEHPCIRNTCQFLEGLGVEVIYLPVNEEGIVDEAILAAHIHPDKTALVSIMWANNETGLLFPVKQLAEITKNNGALFHTDAVQAIGKVPVSVKDVPVDFLTFSAHKFHGPKGVGGLYVRQGLSFTPLLHGGEQMGGKRAGTVNVSGSVGMGLAMELAVHSLTYEEQEVRRLRDLLEDAILALPDTLVVGKKTLRTPNTILASFRGIEGEALLWDLNQYGIAASTGSACASESLEENPTFTAMKLDKELAHTGIRFSLSRFTTQHEIESTIRILNKSVERLRNISSSYHQRKS